METVQNKATPVNNEFLDALIKARLHSREYAVTLAVVRKTAGWGKKFDRISITQFEDMTGINRRHLPLILRSLIGQNIILRQGEGYNLEYGIQPDPNSWILAEKIVTSASNESLPPPVTNSDEKPAKIVTSASNESLPPPVTNSDEKPAKIVTSASNDLLEEGEKIVTSASNDLKNENAKIVTSGGNKSLPPPVMTKETKIYNINPSINNNITKGPLKINNKKKNPEIDKIFEEKVKKVFEGLKERRGIPSPQAAAEAVGIRWMLHQNFTVEQILSSYDYLKTDMFWMGKFLSMQSLKTQINDVVKQGGQSHGVNKKYNPKSPTHIPKQYKSPDEVLGAGYTASLNLIDVEETADAH